MEYKASTQDWPSDELITHFKFCATMQLETPLHVLQRHGETYWDRSRPPPIFFREPWQGIWIPRTSFPDRMALTSMMASEIGPVLTNGSDFHKFLLEIRRIAESTSGLDRRHNAIVDECEKEIWGEIVKRMRGSRAVADRFMGRVKKK